MIPGLVQNLNFQTQQPGAQLVEVSPIARGAAGVEIPSLRATYPASHLVQEIGDFMLIEW